MRAIVSATWIMFTLLACGGCESGDGPHVAPTVPVKGTVTFKGQPVTQGTITFEPEDIGREAHATIQPDGTFVLSTFKEGDGAVPGLHRVAITGSVGRGGKGQQPLPAKYRSAGSSNIAVEVSQEKTDYPIDLN
jgi:hypothetical protein